MSLLPLLLLGALSAAAQDYPLPPAPAPSTSTAHLDFVADHLDYDSVSAKIHLKGNVKVKESTWTIKADELWLDTARRLGEAEGFLLVEDGVSAVSGGSGDFDFARHSGTLRGTSAGHGDWRIHAKSVRFEEDRTLTYYGADFTSCSYDPKPHYHFHASRLSVVPHRHILAYNTLFYLGPVPIFYTPVLYKSLDPTSFLRMKFQPGYDHRNGAFLKGTMTNSLGRHTYSKLFLDFYSAQGVGVGGELERHQGEDSRGSLYGYNIKETGAGRERWAFLGSQYQTLPSSMAFQARLQVQSDPDFNNNYARASTLRVTPQLVNNAAVVYRTPFVTTRLSYSRLDVARSDGLGFLRTAESSPRLDAQTTLLRFWRLPWLNTFTGFADNSYDAGRAFTQRSVGAGWEGTRTFGLVRGVNFIPKAGYQQGYFSRIDSLVQSFGPTGHSTSTVIDAFVGRYSGQGTLRAATPAGDWDLTYLYSRRQKADSLVDDAAAIDHGVENNLLSLVDAYRPNRKILVRAFTGYDFRVFRDRMPGFRERVQPFVGEVQYAPRSSLNLSLRDDYQLGQGNRSFLFSGIWGDETATYFGGGAGYNKASPGSYQLDTEFGWAPSSQSWRFSGALRAVTTTSGGVGHLSRFGLFEKELSVAKSWHDFFTRAQFRLRPGGVREAQIRVDMKLGSVAQDNAQHRDWESEWFPERKKGIEERP